MNSHQQSWWISFDLEGCQRLGTIGIPGYGPKTYIHDAGPKKLSHLKPCRT